MVLFYFLENQTIAVVASKTRLNNFRETSRLVLGLEKKTICYQRVSKGGRKIEKNARINWKDPAKVIFYTGVVKLKILRAR